MKICQVRVQNFRGVVDSGWIDIEDDYTVLVGKNESGKTSILEALSKINNSENIDNSKINITGIDGAPDEYSFHPVVSVVLQPQGDEFQESITELSAPICLTKYANGRREISYEGAPCDPPPEVFASGDCKRWLVEELREAGYLENVTDGGQDETWAEVYSFLFDSDNEDLENVSGILQDLGYKLGDEGLESILSGVASHREDASNSFIGINRLVEKIPAALFEDSHASMQGEIEAKRIPKTNNRISLLLKDLDINWSDQNWPDENRRLLEQFSERLTNELSPKWGQKEISIQFLYSNGNVILRIKDMVSNGGSGDRRIAIPLSERSDGLKRFITILTDIYLSSNGDDDNNLILIDDPGVYFHPNQKEKMRDVITEEFAERGQVIYSTHSPFLIDSSQPKSIRGTRGPSKDVLNDITEVSAESGLEPARPVSEAIGLTIGTDLLTVDRCLLVEGPTEYHLIPALSNYFRCHGNEGAALDGYRVVQMSGAGDAIKYAKWAEQGGVDFQILLDNDEGGEERSSEIQENHPELGAHAWLLDERGNDDDREVEFEDLLPVKLYVSTVNSAIQESTDGPQIEIEETDSGFVIGGKEYLGAGLAGLLDDLIAEREDGFEYRKASIARSLSGRLRTDDITPPNFSRLIGLFAQLRNEDI